MTYGKQDVFAMTPEQAKEITGWTFTVEIRILKDYLSGGELIQLNRIAGKPEYSENEVKFVFAMAARTLKKIRNSLSVDQVSIKPEGMNFLITGK